MNIEIKLILEQGEQDTTNDAIEIAKNALRSMDLEDLIDLFEYKILD